MIFQPLSSIAYVYVIVCVLIVSVGLVVHI